MIDNNKKLDSPKFTIGELVKHRYYPFRGVIFDVDPELLLQRAKLVKENQEFFEKVSQAMQDRIFNFPEPEYVEQKIYSGFPDNDDAELIKDF